MMYKDVLKTPTVGNGRPPDLLSHMFLAPCEGVRLVVGHDSLGNVVLCSGICVPPGLQQHFQWDGFPQRQRRLSSG